MTRTEAKRHVERLVRAGRIRRQAADVALESLMHTPSVMASLEAPLKSAPRPAPVRASIPESVPNAGDIPPVPELQRLYDVRANEVAPFGEYPLGVAAEITQRRAAAELPTVGATITRGP